MKKLLLLALLLPSFATASTIYTPFEYVCAALLSVDCREMSQPAIVYTRLMDSMQKHGAYVSGEHVLFISPNAPPETVVHEMAHYVLYEAGLDLDRCLSEETARRIHHMWLKDEYTEDWRLSYGCLLPSEE